MSDLTEHEIYTRLIDSLKSASGCAQQMAHMRKDPRWLKVRNALEIASTKVTQLAIGRIQ